MHRQATLLTLAVVAGALIGALGVAALSGDPPYPNGPANPSSDWRIPRDGSGTPDAERLADVVESLTRTLNDEINERRILAEQIDELKSELQDLQANLRTRVQQAFQADNVDGQQAPVDATPPGTEDRLQAAGFTRQQLAAIRRLEAETQMRRIDLDDRARREGWINTPRYAQEFQQLATGTSAVRDALGDEAYDRYLFANGQSNRIAVQSIIETSPAQKAGFQTGDVVLRYAGEKVYSTQQLVELRSSGARGEPVTIEILRNGQPMQLTMPRGPMGLSTGPRIVDPDAPQG